jgi:phospholipid/cholesterol/gamma-HCH transport system substrate-binding protein
MSDSPNRQAVIVGLFVSIGIAILAGGVLTIGGLTEAFSRTVRVSAVFDDAGGLQTGDSVWFSGVPVGTVKDVGFAGGPQVEVEMAIARDASTYIHTDALAKVGTDGLIGNPIVIVYEGSAGAPSITDGTVLTAGDAASMDDMLAMLQENNANLLAITEDFRSVADQIASGEGTVGKLLSDDRLYTDVRQTVDTLRDASVNAEVLTANLATFADKMNQPGNLPNQLVTDQETYASIQSTVAQLEAVADDAARIVGGVEEGATNPDTPIGTLLRDEEAGGDLKQTLEQLNTGSKLLNEDLEALQHNFLFRGYFRRQERERQRALEAEQEEREDRQQQEREQREQRPGAAAVREG